MNERALIIVDVQNDFCSGGSLAVPNGDQVVKPINMLIDRFQRGDHPVFATRDWHPVNHCSFVPQGGSWPPHCVRGTEGARFHHDLNVNEQVIVINKAENPDKDAYSGFDGTDLNQQLSQHKVREVYICGLATDYCVKATVLDALKEGFETYIVEDAIRGVDIKAGDSDRAIEEMVAAGAQCIRSDGIAV